MANIQDLPNELLLQIATALWVPGRSKLKPLRNLALVSRQFRPIAQEIIFRCIEIGDHGKRSRALAYLARTLIMCPKLAGTVREFRVWVIKQKVNHICDQDDLDMEQDGYCDCEWATIIDPCVEGMKARNNKNGRPYSEEWIKAVNDGTEPAICGLILNICCSLHVLDLTYNEWTYPGIRHHTWATSYESDSNRTDGRQTRTTPYREDIFPDKDKKYCNPLGMQNLDSFSVNGPLPGGWLQRLEGKELEMTLLGPMSKPVPNATIATDRTIPGTRSLTVRFDLSIFCKHMSERLWYFDKLFPHLTGLRQLEIRISSDKEFAYGRPRFPRTFGRITNSVTSATLETLIVDPSEVVHRWNDQLLIREPKPANSLTHLPNLRHIIGPQEMIVSTSNELVFLQTPPQVETIHVLESIATGALSHWARYILGNRESLFPRLEHISFWKIQHGGLLFHDDTTDIAGGNNLAEVEWKALCNKTIWQDLSSAGIKISMMDKVWKGFPKP